MGALSNNPRDPALARVLSPVLVGRAGDLALLVASVTAPPALAVLEGEAGVGKSRLVEELLGGPAVAGRVALVGNSHAVRQPFHLGPVVEALRGLGPDAAARLRLGPVAGALRPVLPELGPWLPPAPEPLADPTMERHRLWRALAELLGALGPAVVVLEDLHWADEDTIGFLSFLVAEQPPTLALVLTWRGEDLAAGSSARSITTRLPRATTAARLALAPLDAGAVKSLVASILDTEEISDEFAAFLHERTAGLPFAVEEVLALLQDRRDLIRWRGRWARRALDDIGVPTAIRLAVAERLGRLGPDARAVANAASVLDLAADEGLLSAVCGLTRARTRAGLITALASGLVVEQADGVRYGFRHALAAQAAYAAVAGPDRRRLHARAVRAIETGPTPLAMAQLAHHARCAGLNTKWARYAEAAAEQALVLGDPHSAAVVLVEALSVPRLSRSALARIAMRLSGTAVDGLAQTQAVPALRDVLAGGRLSAGERGIVRFNLGALLQQAGDASGSRAEMAIAVGELRRSPVSQARAMANLAIPWVLDGDADDHLGWLERAEAAMSKTGERNEALLADRAAVLAAMGDPRGWEAVAEVSRTDGHGRLCLDWVRACTNVGVSAFYLGHYQRAEGLVADALAGSSGAGYLRLVDALDSTTLLLAWAAGRWKGLEHEARRVWEGPTGLAPSVLQAGLVLGSLLEARGEGVEAETILTVVSDVGPRCGGVPIMAAAAAGLARLDLARSEPEAAASKAIAALDIVARKGIWVWAADVAPVAVEALIACGNIREAVDWVGRLGRGLEGRDAPAATAAHDVCAGLTAEANGRPEEADRRFSDAQTAFERMPRPYEAAQARERRGRSLFEQDRDCGSSLLLDALEDFNRLGASWDQARVTRVLRQRGVALRYPFRGGQRSYGEELSPREREVAEMAATGLSNAEIADQLYLSTRTVEHHLSRALRKLGLRSRHKLATVLPAR